MFPPQLSGASGLVGFVEHPVGIGASTLREKVQTSRLSIASSSDPATTLPSGIARHRRDIGHEQHGDAGDTAIEFGRTHGRILDPDQAVVERLARLLRARRWPARSFRRHRRRSVRAAFPCRPSRRLRESCRRRPSLRGSASRSKPGIGAGDGADACLVGGHALSPPRSTTGWRTGLGACCCSRGAACIAAVEAVRHDLFLMLGPAAEHRIEPQPQKGGDHGEDDDLGDHVSYLLPTFIRGERLRQSNVCCPEWKELQTDNGPAMNRRVARSRGAGWRIC